MATPQLSPGILTREIDLTVGRAENVSDNIGAIAGPFVQGPVEEVIDISTQQDLLKFFGKPKMKIISMNIGCQHPAIYLMVEH